MVAAICSRSQCGLPLRVCALWLDSRTRRDGRRCTPDAQPNKLHRYHGQFRVALAHVSCIYTFAGQFEHVSTVLYPCMTFPPVTGSTPPPPCSAGAHGFKYSDQNSNLKQTVDCDVRARYPVARACHHYAHELEPARAPCAHRVAIL